MAQNYPVVYSVESGGYRRASAAEVVAQRQRQADVRRDTERWKRDNKPDELDRIWSNYADFVRMIERAPHPPKHIMRSWDLRGGRTRKAAPAESVLVFVSTSPGKRTDKVDW